MLQRKKIQRTQLLLKIATEKNKKSENKTRMKNG